MRGSMQPSCSFVATDLHLRMTAFLMICRTAICGDAPQPACPPLPALRLCRPPPGSLPQPPLVQCNPGQLPCANSQLKFKLGCPVATFAHLTGRLGLAPCTPEIIFCQASACHSIINKVICFNCNVQLGARDQADHIQGIARQGDGVCWGQCKTQFRLGQGY